jgi:hypothetical protein
MTRSPTRARKLWRHKDFRGVLGHAWIARKNPKEPAKTRREVKRFTSLLPTRKEIRMDKRCDREPDFTTACITLHENESCDVGVECRRCGEHGFAIATVDRIKGNDDD